MKTNCKFPHLRPGSVSLVARAVTIAVGLSCLTAFTEDRAELHDVNSVERRILSTLEYLASDELRGRAIGSTEIDQAAKFVVEQFEIIGLRTDVFDGSAFQEFSIPGGLETATAETNQLELVLPSEESQVDSEIRLELDSQFRPLAIGGSGSFDCPIVFVGYGITAPDVEFDEYENIDVNGKAVVILRKEPQQHNKESKFNGDKPSNHAFFATKVQNAIHHGAAVVILVNDRAEQLRTSKRQIANWKRQAERLSRVAADEPTSDDINEFRKHRERVEKLARGIVSFGQKIDQADKILAVNGAGTTVIDQNVPVVFCRRDVLIPLIESACDKTLEQIEDEIDTSLTPQSMPLAGWKLHGKVSVKRKNMNVKNIIAVLDGEGPLADETVIVGAHYDHVGMGGPGSLAPWTTAVHNGADDNASGVSAMMEVARRLVMSNKKPRRRVVFIAFTAEESGLLGSQHYVQYPRFDLENTVAMLNLDMVGRLNDRPLEVSGVGTSDKLEEIVDRVASETDVKIKKSAEGNGPSDHASFNAKRIPVLHFFTGLHSDYHRPSDDVEKIDFAGIVRIVNFVSGIATEIVDADERLKYREVAKLSRNKRRAFLGLRLEDSPQGCELVYVVPDSPAHLVGLAVGDVIVSIDGTSVSKYADLVEPLSAKSPGDEVTLLVVHEKAQQSFKVKLGESR